jgi:hypothetical protein
MEYVALKHHDDVPLGKAWAAVRALGLSRVWGPGSRSDTPFLMNGMLL